MPKKIPEPVGPSHSLCIGSSCKEAGMLHINLPPRPAFHYTSPSAIPPRTKKERLARGCELRNNKFTGRVCKDGECVADAFCKITQPPCDQLRAQCPVQLIFVQGQPTLRFCKKKSRPGYLVPVSSPAQAQSLAEKACRAWKTPKNTNRGKNKTVLPPWPSTFFERNAPDMVTKARQAHPDSAWGKPGLGFTEPSSIPPILPALGAAAVAIALAIFKK